MDIFNKLTSLPLELQTIIIKHYKSSITKDHIKHDAAMFVKNYSGDKALIEIIESVAIDYVTRMKKNFDSEGEEFKRLYTKKLKEDMKDILIKHVQKFIIGKDLRPIIFLELHLSLKYGIRFCRDAVKKRYPNSKRKRERYFQQIYKPSTVLLI